MSICIENNNIEFIWSITKFCSKKCKFCCVDAVFVNPTKIELNQNIDTSFKVNGNTLPHIPCDLDILHKNIILNNIAKLNRQIKIDFSGGDPLLQPENLLIVKQAAKLFKKENISISTTLHGITNTNICELTESLSEIGLSFYDFFHEKSYYSKKINNTLYTKLLLIYESGTKIKIHIPLVKDFLNRKYCNKIFNLLKILHVSEILLMRVFPVGRLFFNDIGIPTKIEYLEIINNFLELESKYHYPKISIQCALQGLFSQNINNCKMGCNSFGITNDGMLILSAWGYERNGKILGKEWIVGDLKVSSLSDILNEQHVKEFEHMGRSNQGHCKVFCWLYGEKNPDSFFKDNDPLLSS